MIVHQRYDETFGMLLVLLSVPFSPWWWLLAFVAFRFFDILKPWPIRLADVYSGGASEAAAILG